MKHVRRFSVDLWSAAETEEYIRARLPGLLQAYDDAAPLPPVLTKADPDYFMCAGCPVARECAILAMEGK